jgi:hypothetical protein
MSDLGRMAQVLYRCPRTGRYAHSWITEDGSAEADRHADHTYLSVLCPACARLHMVNPATRQVLGDDA